MGFTQKFIFNNIIMSSLSSDDKKYRKKIFLKIAKITKKDLYFRIYQVILDNKEIHNVNHNGVFFDLYKISLNSIKTIENILQINYITTEDDSNTYQNYSESVTETNEDIIHTTLPISHLDKL